MESFALEQGKKRKKREEASLSHFCEDADVVSKIVTPFKLSNKIFLWVKAKHGKSQLRGPALILPQELSSCMWGFWWKVSGPRCECRVCRPDARAPGVPLP